jgi:hypothetical protein
MPDEKCAGSGQFGRIEWQRDSDGAWVSQCGVCDAEVPINDEGAIEDHNVQKG